MTVGFPVVKKAQCDYTFRLWRFISSLSKRKERHNDVYQQTFKLAEFPSCLLRKWECSYACVCSCLPVRAPLRASTGVRVMGGLRMDRCWGGRGGCVSRSAGFNCAASLAEWCSPPGRRCTFNTQTPAYFTNKCWLVCLASAPPQINNINALQILVFSLITEPGALRLNPQQSLRMETAGCVFVCAYQANYTVKPLVSFAWGEYFALVCLPLFILIDTSNSILPLTNSYHRTELCCTCLCNRI